MSKFNSGTASAMQTQNKCGHAAYTMFDKEKLVTQVLTSFFNEKKFYGDNSAELIATLRSVIKTDPEFVAKLTYFARNVFNLRSISHVMACELAHLNEGKPYVRKLIRNIVHTPGDVTEMFAYYCETYGDKAFPNSLKKGLKDAFEGFDIYQLGKYKQTNSKYSLRNALKFIHPRPKNEEMSTAYVALIEGKLETPYTWETELSAKGNTKETWEQLIASGKVGYMALLRNLRNIVKAEPENIDVVLDIIGDPAKVRNSKQLPFRFFAAYKELVLFGCSTKTLNAVKRALNASIANMPHFTGRTLLAVDRSYSMTSKISNKSSISCYDIAKTLMGIANIMCEDATCVLFNYNLTKGKLYDDVFATIDSAPGASGCTDMTLPLVHALENNLKFDRIIFISDNETNGAFNRSNCQSLLKAYKNEVNPDVWIHAIDIQGYGTQQFAGPNVNIVAGWSEKVLEYCHMKECGVSSLIKEIENVVY